MNALQTLQPRDAPDGLTITGATQSTLNESQLAKSNSESTRRIDLRCCATPLGRPGIFTPSNRFEWIQPSRLRWDCCLASCESNNKFISSFTVNRVFCWVSICRAVCVTMTQVTGGLPRGWTQFSSLNSKRSHGVTPGASMRLWFHLSVCPIFTIRLFIVKIRRSFNKLVKQWSMILTNSAALLGNPVHRFWLLFTDVYGRFHRRKLFYGGCPDAAVVQSDSFYEHSLWDDLLFQFFLMI